MGQDQCFVCGEIILDGWDHCPACGHPYPVDRDNGDDTDECDWLEQ